MKRWKLSCLLLAALGCGNYSNDDIEFLNALPHTSDLTSKVPQQNGSPLQQDAGTAPTCGSALGQTSCFYTSTLSSSEQFNQGLFDFLGIIDDINQLPATSRTADGRTWGPYPSTDQPGFNVEVIIDKTPPNLYSWAIQFQQEGAPSDASWFQLVSGEFTATGGARIGQGTLKIDGPGALAIGLPTNLGDTLLVGSYLTNQEPVSVNFAASAQDGGEVLLLTYYSHEYLDDAGNPASGALNFVAPQETDAGLAYLQLHSGWVPSGAGRGDATILPGSPYAGAMAVQCWGPAPLFPIVYQAANWDPSATVGDPTMCVDAGGL